MLIIKQLEFVPLFYQCLLQQNLDAIPISWQTPKPISNPMSTTSIDLSVLGMRSSPITTLFALKSRLGFTTQVCSSTHQPFVMALILDFCEHFKKIPLKLKTTPLLHLLHLLLQAHPSLTQLFTYIHPTSSPRFSLTLFTTSPTLPMHTPMHPHWPAHHHHTFTHTTPPHVMNCTLEFLPVHHPTQLR